ncbi:MAG: hypothetical protein RQ715_08305 [Methylococcales bacterium]|nr:hypothetical protein [Methylococcales bacterium]
MNVLIDRLIKSGGLGRLINTLQTLFVSLLRIWSIPIVLALSVASGYTTYHGMANFITPWIALIITVAIQSIVVIASLEMAGIHWKANRLRYLSVLLSLLVALSASVSFSYFKFYQISQSEQRVIDRINQVKTQVDQYLVSVRQHKGALLNQYKQDVERLAQEQQQAYFGTHPDIAPQFRHHVGEGPFYRQYHQRYQAKQAELTALLDKTQNIDQLIAKAQQHLYQLDQGQVPPEAEYRALIDSVRQIQFHFDRELSPYREDLPIAPNLMTYAEFTQDIKPSFAMWQGFSAFAFVSAAMVDFFTVLLSYRLEFAAPGPLTEREERLVFECLKQFSQFRINNNDALELVIEKTELERARRYIDWPRMFAVGLLLSRGFLRKIDAKTVEFAPNLYPLMAEKMADKLDALAKAQADENTHNHD